MQAKPDRRHLKLLGSLNLRELGGHLTSEQKQTKWNTLLRSDSLHHLTLLAQEQLIDYGVKTIIDLRSSIEATEEYPLSKDPAIQYWRLPLVEDIERINSIAETSLLEHNYFFLQECSSAIAKILETINSSKAAIVIHCAAGKDRTGIIIALLLALAKVPVETIAEDYALSDRYLAPLYERMRSRAKKQGYAHLLNSQPQTIIDTFNFIDNNYGGIEQYLDSIGINTAKRSSLKMMLVQ